MAGCQQKLYGMQGTLCFSCPYHPSRMLQDVNPYTHIHWLRGLVADKCTILWRCQKLIQDLYLDPITAGLPNPSYRLLIFISLVTIYFSANFLTCHKL